MEFLQKIKPRDYQKQILQTCISKNCLVVLPTGLGKTLIALMLAIERMKAFPREKVVFLAPTRPLAEQHLRFFKENLPELFGDMQLFTGEVKANQRKEIWQTADIIFSTPQCIANDLQNRLYNMSSVCLLVEDEAHRCVKSYDYRYVAERYIEHAENPRILGMTASPGSEVHRIKEICDNLHVEAVELRTRESPDVAPYLKELKTERVFLDLPSEMIEIQLVLNRLFNQYIEELRNRKVLFGLASKTELLALQKRLFLSISKGNKNFNNLLAVSTCAQSIKLQHALELLETQTHASFNKYLQELFRQAAAKESKGAIKLVARPEFALAFAKSNELVARGLEHPKVDAIIKIIKEEKAQNPKAKAIVFMQFRETAKLIAKKVNDSGFKANVFVGQAKKKDKAGKEESTGLSQKEQKAVISDFASGNIDVICATSIGEEGLDIPEVSLVIFYEPVPSAIRTIQRGGRTARLSDGKIIFLITKKTRDEAFFYAAKAREKKMHSAISTVQNRLANKLPEEPEEEQETLD